MEINGYTLIGELQNANSGFSKWGFATKNGKEYFIKELIKPVYPIDRSVMTDEMFEQRRIYCQEYEAQFRKHFSRVNTASHGNIVRVNEFFRHGSRYYLVTDKVDGKKVSMAHFSTLNSARKLALLKSIAYCFKDLHSAGVVHFDVKPDNILIKETRSHNYAAKLIDFDSGFLKGDKLEDEELGGDLTYLAPETFLGICGEDVKPDEKADIFALGLVFHEYYCGRLPFYDESEYEYPYEAALDKGMLTPDTSRIPVEICKLIVAMLDVDPKNRPSADDIVNKLDELSTNERYTDIKSITVRFSGHYGKSINITCNKIQYRNTIHPTVQAETRNFPASYTAQIEKNIPPEQFNSIIDEITEAGMMDLVAPYREKNAYPGAVYQILSVVYTDGRIYDYSTSGEPSATFKKITDILSRYCEFPAIDPSWYESVTKVATTTPSPYTTPTVDSKPRVSPSKDGSGWFQQAGDL